MSLPEQVSSGGSSATDNCAIFATELRIPYVSLMFLFYRRYVQKCTEMAGNHPVTTAGNLQLGLGNLLLSLGSLPQLQPTASPKALCKYTYLVRFVNPKKKSEFTLREWHDVEERFTTIEHLKFNLLDTFQRSSQPQTLPLFKLVTWNRLPKLKGGYVTREIYRKCM